MTTHDERATTAAAQAAEPQFSSAAAQPSPEHDVPATESNDAASDGAPIEGSENALIDASPPPTEPHPTRTESSNVDNESSSDEVQPSDDELLFAADTSGLRSRWDDIQAVFVDDPADCVQKADTLVSEVVDQLTAAFSEARSRLEAQWARGEQASTEDLRLALQRYREFFQRLLAV